MSTPDRAGAGAEPGSPATRQPETTPAAPQVAWVSVQVNACTAPHARPNVSHETSPPTAKGVRGLQPSDLQNPPTPASPGPPQTPRMFHMKHHPKKLKGVRDARPSRPSKHLRRRASPGSSFASRPSSATVKPLEKRSLAPLLILSISRGRVGVFHVKHRPFDMQTSVV